MLFKLVFISIAVSISSVTSAKYVTINNTGTENLVIYTDTEGEDSQTIEWGLLQSGESRQFETVDVWAGSFYAYPEECLGNKCSYVKTKARLIFAHEFFGRLYDYVVLDMSEGYNFRTTIKSSSSDCNQVTCTASEEIFEKCYYPVSNDEGEIVACGYDFLTFYFACPGAAIGASHYIAICKSDSYDITFSS